MAEINIALECFGSILTLILLGSLLLHGDRSNPSPGCLWGCCW